MSEAIAELYRKAGFPTPTGKGIHTYLFHKCVVDIKKKLRAGTMKKTYIDDNGKRQQTNPYQICMDELGRNKAVKKAHQQNA